MSKPAHPSSPVDQWYYQNTGKMNFAWRISIVTRRRVHELFMQVIKPQTGDRILDIGESNNTGADSNMLEQLYPHRENLTCTSLTDGQSILATYPGVRHVQIVAGEPLPFDRNSFDIINSSTVFKYTESAQRQKQYFAELCRVALRSFLAVPNRHFPIDHHTCLPFLHHLPKSWFRQCLRGSRYDFWSHEENLNYVSAVDLRRMWPGDSPPALVYNGIGFGPWKSNLVAYQT